MLKTLLFLLGLSVVASRRYPFYRKDYTYVDQFGAFYKVHWDLSGISWSSAFLACDDEESSLFYPKTKDEWTVAKSLVAAMNAKPNVSDIFVGIHDEFGLGEFITVDGLPTETPILAKDQVATDVAGSCITMDIDTGTFKIDNCDGEIVKPFLCKKKLVIEGCPTVDTGYKYIAETKKCYKINERKKSWTDAMQTCFLEGGILAVIRNEREAQILNDMSPNDPHFVGFRRLFVNGDFYTVKGHKLEDSFYTRWSDGRNDDKMGDCGVVLGTYTGTSHCHEALPFVCEMTVAD